MVIIPQSFVSPVITVGVAGGEEGGVDDTGGVVGTEDGGVFVMVGVGVTVLVGVTLTDGSGSSKLIHIPNVSPNPTS